MQQNFETIPPVILDLGEHSIRLGLKDQLEPLVQPNVIGYPVMTFPSIKPYYVGEEAFSEHAVKVVNRPINNGHLTDAENLVKILHHTFFALLKVNPYEHRIVVSTHAARPIEENYLLIELLFEDLGVPAALLVNGAFETLLAHKTITGLVVEIGNTTTRIVPYYEGYKIEHGVVILDFGGELVVRYLERLLKEQGIPLLKHKKTKKWLEDTIKEHCYVALNPEKEAKVYELHTSFNREKLFFDEETKVVLKTERYQAAEVIFEPELMTSEKSLIEGILESIERCDTTIRKELMENILLSGGIASMYGFNSRLQYELNKLSPMQSKIQTSVIKDKSLLPWIGGKIITELKSFKEKWITLKIYKQEKHDLINKIVG